MSALYGGLLMEARKDYRDRSRPVGKFREVLMVFTGFGGHQTRLTRFVPIKAAIVTAIVLFAMAPAIAQEVAAPTPEEAAVLAEQAKMAKLEVLEEKVDVLIGKAERLLEVAEALDETAKELKDQIDDLQGEKRGFFGTCWYYTGGAIGRGVSSGAGFVAGFFSDDEEEVVSKDAPPATEEPTTS